MKSILDHTYDTFNPEAFLAVDPCGTVHQLMQHTDSQLDIELGALLVAMISWGSRKVIVPTAIHMLRDEMHWQPAHFIKSGEYAQSYHDAKRQCVYRTLNVPTFHHVCHNLQHELDGYDTMEARLNNLTAKDAIAEICRWLAPARLGTMPSSACKRVCMFMRWMVRPYYPDLGLWTSRSPADLYAVMDTHVCQQTRHLLKHKRPTWQACEELTALFNSWNPADPLRYDIALMTLADSKNDTALASP